MRFVRWLVSFSAVIWLGVAAASAAAPVKPVDPLAQYVKASAWVEAGKGRLYIEMLSDGENAAFRARSDASPVPELYRLSSPNDVLRFLADRRMSVFWQPLKSWAGPSLEVMRERITSQRRAAFERHRAEFATASTGQSTVGEPVKALLQLADFLIETGRAEEAEQLLRQQLAKMPFNLKGTQRGIEWQSVASEIGRARKARMDLDGAIAQFDYVERVMAGSPYALNVAVNRAAFLAEAGRYQQALPVIEQAWSDFDKTRDDDDVTGSDRQFAWVKACALHGLGRKVEAAALMATIEPDQSLSDPDFMIEPNNSIRFRAAMCMKDVPAIKAMLLANFNSGAVAPSLLIWMQPGRTGGRNQEIADAIRADPELQAVARDRMEILPPELTPALNGWRPIAAPTRAAAVETQPPRR